MGRPGEAVGPFRVALGRAQYWVMYANLATALGRSGDAAGGMVVCREGLEKWPESERLYVVLGELLGMEGDWAGAREAYGTALKLKPGMTEAASGVMDAERRVGAKKGS
jgi:Flp pilus assembly protein TadD